MPGPSIPDAEPASVPNAPTATALAFIFAAATSRPPSIVANVLAASLPDTSSSASSSWRVV